ncbi:MAG: family 10 glycosylhydrolase [Promethearchaeota archaeon]
MTRKPEKAYFLAIMLVAVLLVSTTLASLSTTVSFHNSGRIDYPIISYGKTQQSELRAALIKFIFNYNHDDELICQTLANYGFNAVYLELDPMAWTGFMLKDFSSMISACNKYGLEFHVLLIFGTYDPDYTDSSEDMYPQFGLSGGSNPDWRMVDANGNYVSQSCFQKASTRARVKQVIETMVTMFPDIVDINLDYVRYPTTYVNSRSVCYCDECKAAFETWLAQNGKDPIGSSWPGPFVYGGARWKDFAEWRCIPINNMVRDVRQWALAKNPDISFSADTWVSYAGWTPDTWKDELGQDPAYWVSQGWIDSINPMVYTNSLSSLSSRIDNEQQYHLGDSKGAVPLVPFMTQGGPGSDVGSPIPVSTWIQEINMLREEGANGFIIWRYSGPGLQTGWTNIEPYLAAVRDSTEKGAFPVFKQSSPIATGSTIEWQTSLPTTGRVEYSSSPMFTTTLVNGALLPYLDVNYVPGTVISESTATLNHSITVPISPPFYYRIIDEDAYIELASTVYRAT